MRAPTIQDRLEAIGLKAVVAMISRLTVSVSSAIGGNVFGLIGPWLGTSKRARRNLARAFPDWTAKDIENTVQAMWRNLGRTAFELPHLGALMPYQPGSRIEVVGAEQLCALAAGDRPVIFFSGHMGNWELSAMAIRWHPAYAGQIDRNGQNDKVCIVYRAMNNPLTDAIVLNYRQQFATPNAFAKGAAGARQIIDFLRRNGAICMLIDQKMNDGIPVEFFGRPAWTAPAAAQFALKYNAILVPVSNVRLKGAHFRITFHDPIQYQPTGDRPADTIAIMRMCNAFLEDCITAHPEQWFWVHRRWPD
jgi:KDO2-lipid IV(A) lauroyltransferase